MPRMPADPVGRLAVLEAARGAIEDGLIVNFDEMAKIAGMSSRNLKLIVARDPEFPIAKKGGEGVPYEIDAAAALDHMIGSARAARDVREARMATVTRLAGLGAGAVAPSPGDGGGNGSGSAADDPKALTEHARAITAIVDARAKLRAQMREEGSLLDRPDVERFLWEWLTALQEGVLAISSRLDPAGQLDPAVRKGIDDEMANILVEMRGALEARIETWNAARH